MATTKEITIDDIEQAGIKIEAQHAKEITSFIAEMQEKTDGELSDIRKALIGYCNDKAPHLNELAILAGKEISKKQMEASGLNAELFGSRTTTKYNAKTGEPEEVTKYFLKTGLKQLNAKVIGVQKMQSASDKYKHKMSEYENFLEEYQNAEKQFKEMSKDLTAFTDAECGKITKAYRTAEAKHSKFLKDLGISAEEAKNTANLVKAVIKKQTLENASKQARITGHIKLNRAKVDCINHILYKRQADEINSKGYDIVLGRLVKE